MEKENWRSKWVLFVGCLAAVLLLLFFLADSDQKTPVRRLLRNVGDPKSRRPRLYTDHRQQAVLDNGIIEISLSIPKGHVLGIKYNGIDNVVESRYDTFDRGYWDVVWNEPGKPSTFERVNGTTFRVITENEEQVEVSFSRKWDVSLRGKSVALNIDKRYILRRGMSGFYSYAIFERLKGWPAVEIDQIRIVYKLRSDKFSYMAISDDKQRIMPTMADRLHGQPLAYPEAVLLTNPANPELRGEVDDKYQYSLDNKDNKVHGWISPDPPVGFWVITPSNEFRNAGPVKQDLTSHAGPIALSMFVSTHYCGKEVSMKFKEGEPWKKVFGPILVHLNSVSRPEQALELWKTAKEQMFREAHSWPYNFAQSRDFFPSAQRGTVVGRLLIRDRFMSPRLIYAQSAVVGLAAPGEVGSWQRESKGYQFWSEADVEGYFKIENILPGKYNLYAWVPGIIGDYKNETMITIQAGMEVKMDLLVYRPPRHGPTLWEIGVPDRSAAEFYIPDPYPTLMNKLYNDNPEKFRQYGLWERYTDIYRLRDLIYEVNSGDYSRNWFFAHVNRRISNGTYEPATWKIKFELERLNTNGNYVLQMALASANDAELQVRFNDVKANPAHFSTGVIGGNNVIARHGIHGLYWLYSIDVASALLREGDNTIYLTQTRSRSPFQGVMYDYLRLEGPP